MILSDTHIKQLLETDSQISIDPYDESNVQPASYDVTLGSSFTMMDALPGRINDLTESGEQISPDEHWESESDRFQIGPKDFVLAHTKERVELDPSGSTTYSAEVKGRSSIGRSGLIIHTAGWIDPGFEGQITLELFNATDYPIVVEPGMRIGQLVFKMTTPVTEGYGEKSGSKYQGQSGVTPSRFEEEQN